ncbi:HK97 gp10 family phage protein [Clostridium chromiireducens]|uniref:HK97 gp10 family phage protein n=1 Tax=Clostridium chromiireducens TaxID=225345 RepID=UPI003AF77D2E
MSDFGFDFKELAIYEKKLLEAATEKMPREARKFVNKEGTKLKRITVKTARAKVKKKTGNYLKSIKKGKPYIYKGNGGYSVRVYHSPKIAPHAHLIEDGHRIVNHEGQEVGYKPGLKVVDGSRREFESTFYQDIENFIDDMLGKGL